MVKSLFVGERVRLGPLTDSDLDVIAQWYADGEWIRMLSAFDVPTTRERLEQWLDRYRNHEKSFLFGIRTKDDNRLIGMVTLEDILWNHGTGWLSISIGPEHRSNGYGEEALRLILDFAFDECNLHRVQLTVFSYNRPAVGLYEKLGFQREGCYREFLHRDGRRHDMWLYGLLRREWENGKKNHH
jgi:RimJ/RimL family protein N-acetyltransferase